MEVTRVEKDDYGGEGKRERSVDAKWDEVTSGDVHTEDGPHRRRADPIGEGPRGGVTCRTPWTITLEYGSLIEVRDRKLFLVSTLLGLL